MRKIVVQFDVGATSVVTYELRQNGIVLQSWRSSPFTGRSTRTVWIDDRFSSGTYELGLRIVTGTQVSSRSTPPWCCSLLGRDRVPDRDGEPNLAPQNRRDAGAGPLSPRVGDHEGRDTRHLRIRRSRNRLGGLALRVAAAAARATRCAPCRDQGRLLSGHLPSPVLRARSRPPPARDSSAYSAEQLSCRYAYLQVRVTVDGYSGHQVWLRWVLDGRPRKTDRPHPERRAPAADRAEGARQRHRVEPPPAAGSAKECACGSSSLRKHDSRLLAFSEAYTTPSFR